MYRASSCRDQDGQGPAAAQREQISEGQRALVLAVTAAKALPAANRVTADTNLVIRGKASKAHVRREIRSNSFWLGRGGACRS